MLTIGKRQIPHYGPSMFSPAVLFLALLIVTTPVILIFDGPIIHGAVIAVAAVSVADVGLRIRPGEAGFLLSVIRPMAFIAAVPALWMLFQLLPLNTAWLGNPIWQSAAAELGRPLGRSISIDPGATLVSLARYLSAVAIAFVAAAAALSRRRAAMILSTLLVATTIIALMTLMPSLGYFKNELRSAGATDSAALGIILAVTMALHVHQRSKEYGTSQYDPAVRPRLIVTTCLVAAVICALAIIVDAASQTYFAIACGIATLAIAVFIRRFSLGPWGNAAIASTALVIAIVAVALRPGWQTNDLTIVFASHASSPLITLTQRMITETSWTGTGAGTFAAVLPIYRDIDELASGAVAPTAAATIAVEMGRPFFWAMVMAAIALVVMLLRGALRRGRDWFFSITGASYIVTMMILAIVNVGLFSTPVLVILSAAIGTAITQSRVGQFEISLRGLTSVHC